MYAGIGALLDQEYFAKNCEKIIKNREKMLNALKELGFIATNSKANFVFAKHEGISGEKLYSELKKKGVLVRYFNKPRINDYVRITVGNDTETDALIFAVKAVLKENL